MTFNWSFFIFGVLAVVKAQQGYPRDNPADQLSYNSESQKYREDEISTGDEIPGEAGKDYPIFAEVPETQFDCSQQQFPGYYADVEARCQVFHICQNGGRKDSFLCPNGTVFNQEKLVCDWWYNFDCAQAQSFYSVNEAIVRAMEEAERLSAEKEGSQGYGYNAPSGSRNQQQRPSSSNIPQSDFDTIVVEAARTAPRAQLESQPQPQRPVYDRPEVARRQPTNGGYGEDNRSASKFTEATFGQPGASRDAEVFQEPGRGYLPSQLQANKY